MPSISIVMPVYNAEKFISESIHSIQNQTWGDWELLVVDDGSTDNTLDILQGFAAADSRIRVIVSDHNGVASARQKGMERASGTYLMFCDADDKVEPSALEVMYKNSQEHDLDLCVTGFYRDELLDQGAKCVTEIRHLPTGRYLTKDDFHNASLDLFREGYFQGVTGILYRTKRLESLALVFEAGPSSDHDFILSYLKQIDRVGVVSDLSYHFKKYHHRQRTPQRELEILQLCKRDYDCLIKLYTEWNLIDNPDIYQGLHEIFFNELTTCIEDICNPSCVISLDHKYEILRRIVEEDCTQKAVSVVSPKNRMQQMLIGPIKKKNLALLYSEARFISFIKHYNSSVVSMETSDIEEDKDE